MAVALTNTALRQYQQEFTRDSGGWRQNTNSSGTNAGPIAYGAGVFVLAQSASASTVQTSSDGLTWTTRNLPFTGTVQSIAYGNGYFVLSASANRSAFSTDGINWTSGGAFSSSATWNLIYGNGIFVGYTSSTTAVQYSTNNGTSWTGVTGLAQVSYTGAYGAGLFVLWTSGSTSFLTSPDGATWTTRTKGDSSTLVMANGAMASNGTSFVSVANATSMQGAYSSNDGITWTLTTGGFQNTATYTGVVWGGDRYVIVAKDTNYALTSTDGTNWTQIFLPGSYTWGQPAYGGGRVVVPSTNQAYIAVMGTNPNLTWTCPIGVYTIDALLVAGGGGGGHGAAASSGGGGGGQVARRFLTVVPGTVYSITVGAGGSGGKEGNGANGINTSFGSLLTALGGGGGGGPAANGTAGACGGGGGGSAAVAGGGGGGGVAGPGETARYWGTTMSAQGQLGGAGLAGGAGGNSGSTSMAAGSGGAGIDGFGGGGGGVGTTTFGIGAAGGGRGSASNTYAAVAAAAANSGSGGGACSGTGTSGGVGGSGYCQISWWA